MKLNPPETAPRDGTMILAKSEEGIFRAAWSECHRYWIVGKFIKNSGKPASIFFKVSGFKHEEMIGWLPLPAIDDEGNVK